VLDWDIAERSAVLARYDGVRRGAGRARRGRVIQAFNPIGGENEIAAVSDVLRSGWLGPGPKAGEHVGSARSRELP